MRRKKIKREEIKNSYASNDIPLQPQAKINLLQRNRRRFEGSKKEIDLLWNLSTEMICYINRKGFFIRLNPAWTNILGWTIDELISSPVINFIHPDDRTLTYNVIMMPENRISAGKCESRIQCKDGSYKQLRWNSFFYYESNITLSIVHQVQETDLFPLESKNISKQKLLNLGRSIPVEENDHKKEFISLNPQRTIETESVLENNFSSENHLYRRNEQLFHFQIRYQNIFERNPIGISITTSDGYLLACNPAFAKMFGFSSPEEVVGYNSTILYQDSESRREWLEQLYKQKKLENIEVLMRRINGQSIYMKKNIEGTFNELNELTEIIEYTIDESDRKLMERHLIQKQKTEILGTLANGIAHDFNNILGIILGYCSALEHDIPNPDKLTQTMNAISKIIERGSSLTHQILTFAQKNEIALEPVNVNTVIQGLSKMLHETFPKNIRIELDLDNALPPTLMNHPQLNQVLLNLCVNARDAMAGNVQKTSSASILKIQTKKIGEKEIKRKYFDAKLSPYISIEVTDTGSGMDEPTRKKIFEPFFTTKEKGKGTGLGLAIVLLIVKNHEGFIDVESQEGYGTTFKLFFPLPEQSPNSVLSENNKFIKILGGTEKILLAEGENGLNLLMKKHLELKGYTVFMAKDGFEAIELYAGNRDKISLALLDLELPNLDGTRVFMKMRRMNPHQKVILTSSFIHPDEKEKLIKSGLSEFVQKPYVPNEILRKIRDVLDCNDPTN